jgi:hypothetical protein
MAYKVIIEPHGQNPGVAARAVAKVKAGDPENTGGMIVYMQADNGTKEEVSRVAYIRRGSVCKNPKNSFSKQLGIEVKKAQDGIKAINDLLASAGENQ